MLQRDWPDHCYNNECDDLPKCVANASPTANTTAIVRFCKTLKIIYNIILFTFIRMNNFFINFYIYEQLTKTPKIF